MGKFIQPTNSKPTLPAQHIPVVLFLRFSSFAPCVAVVQR